MDKIVVNGKQLNVLAVKSSIHDAKIMLVQGWNESTPFVVYRVYSDGSCVSGSYCVDIYSALVAFNNRK